MVDNFTELDDFLNKIKIPVRLACTTETGWPVVLSLWYIHHDGHLYCATQESARVVDYLKKDPRCGFEIAEDHPPYCGVRGQAKAIIRKDKGFEILEELLLRYLGTLKHPLAKDLLAKGETEVAIELEPLQIFTWNFSRRMKGIHHLSRADSTKICP